MGRNVNRVIPRTREFNYLKSEMRSDPTLFMLSDCQNLIGVGSDLILFINLIAHISCLLLLWGWADRAPKPVLVQEAPLRGTPRSAGVAGLRSFYNLLGMVSFRRVAEIPTGGGSKSHRSQVMEEGSGTLTGLDGRATPHPKAGYISITCTCTGIFIV